jgi:hypothetical protein
MSARRENGIGLVRRLAHDPWRKLIALLLAIGLWYYLDGKVTDRLPLDVRLELVDRQSASDSRSDATLDIYVPRGEFTLLGFHDSVAQRKIDAVKLHFEGSKNLIQRVKDERPRMRVRPSDVDLQGNQPTIHIDISKIEPVQRDFAGLLKDMEPGLITVRLERNATSPLVFPSAELLMINHPTGDGDLLARVNVDKVRFEPDNLQLYGTQSAIDTALKEKKLFEVELADPIGTNQTEIKSQLRLRGPVKDLGVRMRPPVVTAIFPVTQKWQEVLLRGVPVYLHTERTGRPASEFSIEPEHVDVRIHVRGPLEPELASADLDDWIKSNVLALASLRESPRPGDVITPVVRFLDTRWREDTDYKIVTVENVIVNPKQDP